MLAILTLVGSICGLGSVINEAAENKPRKRMECASCGAIMPNGAAGVTEPCCNERRIRVVEE